MSDHYFWVCIKEWNNNAEYNKYKQTRTRAFFMHSCILYATCVCAARDCAWTRTRRILYAQSASCCFYAARACVCSLFSMLLFLLFASLVLLLLPSWSAGISCCCCCYCYCFVVTNVGDRLALLRRVLLTTIHRVSPLSSSRHVATRDRHLFRSWAHGCIWCSNKVPTTAVIN